MRFAKMHGAGNDFVVLDLRDGGSPPDAALAAALADRHRGVGCDQILTVEPPRGPVSLASYRIWNADGSASQQCGNGARCIAAWLVRDAALTAAPGAPPLAAFDLDSPAGSHAVDALPEGHFAIAMGVPVFEPGSIPLGNVAGAADSYDAHVPGTSSPIRFGAVSMGNPHAVLVVDDVETAPVGVLAPALQASAYFPESVNVGFAQVVSRDRIRLRVYERGVGETLACGSGACAAAVVLMRRGVVDRDLTVSLPGGDLQIQWPDDGAGVILSGPTRFVFEGEWLA